jgi:hypothetical protein
LLPNNLADKEQGVSKTRQPVEKVLVGPVIVLKQEQNTPKPVFSVPEQGTVRDMKEFFNTLGRFGALLAPLQNTCAFSHLYPPPLHVVVRLVMTTSAEPRFTLRVPGFYSRSWIWVSEKTPSRHLGEYRRFAS